jgi:hypothetical protein
VVAVSLGLPQPSRVRGPINPKPLATRLSEICQAAHVAGSSRSKLLTAKCPAGAGSAKHRRGVAEAVSCASALKGTVLQHYRQKTGNRAGRETAQTLASQASPESCRSKNVDMQNPLLRCKTSLPAALTLFPPTAKLGDSIVAKRTAVIVTRAPRRPQLRSNGRRQGLCRRAACMSQDRQREVI